MSEPMTVDEWFESLPLPVDPGNPCRRVADLPVFAQAVADAAAGGLVAEVEEFLRSLGGAS
ncbi:MAG: hypothetical protein FWF28_07185 [Micrococcales bacterium]|nr:hypothetical protein [Micrococcales bacterium]